MKRALGLLVVVVTLGACSWVNPLTGVPGATDPAPAHQRAQAVLEAWAKAVATVDAPRVIPVGDRTGQIGDWEPAVGDNNKRALMAGLVFTDTPFPEATPPDGVVTWQDGTTTKVRLLSAQDALVAIGTTTSSPCRDCAPVMVTAPRLTSGPIETTRGPATAPIWEFSVEGSAVKVTRVGLANPVVVPPLGGQFSAWAGDRRGQRDGRWARTHGFVHRRTRSGGQSLRRGLHGGSRRVRVRSRRDRDETSPSARAARRRVFSRRGTAHRHSHPCRRARRSSRA